MQTARIPGRRRKRLLDLTLIALSLPITLPLFGFIALWIKLTSRGPVFFRQERLGLGARPFALLKFRSMRPGADTGVHENHFSQLKASDTPMTKLDQLGDVRLIPGGGLLRASGLDELPQLINIVRGEMSLVGPRPCTPKELAHYEPHQRKRFNLIPGLTGLWQVNGKNSTTFTQMVALDDHYHDHQSLRLDLWIIARTPAVLAGQVLEIQRRRREQARAAQADAAPGPDPISELGTKSLEKL